MTDRATELTLAAETLEGDFGLFLDGLQRGDLQAPCADHGGETVADVLAHVQDGLLLFRTWLGSVGSGAASGATDSASARMHHRAAHDHAHDHAHGHGHGHGHTHGHGGGLLGKVSALFRGDGAHAHHHPLPANSAAPASDPSQVRAWFAGQLREGRQEIARLSPAQLTIVPPATQGLADGMADLGQVVAMALAHQREHLALMEDAVSAARAGKSPS